MLFWREAGLHIRVDFDTFVSTCCAILQTQGCVSFSLTHLIILSTLSIASFLSLYTFLHLLHTSIVFLSLSSLLLPNFSINLFLTFFFYSNDNLHSFSSILLQTLEMELKKLYVESIGAPLVTQSPSLAQIGSKERSLRNLLPRHCW